MKRNILRTRSNQRSQTSTENLASTWRIRRNLGLCNIS